MSPGACDRMVTISWVASATGLPSTAVTRSPCCRPAISAGLPLVTPPICAPGPAKAMSSSTPMIGVDDVPVVTISSTMRLAVSIGMAKPRPMEPG